MNDKIANAHNPLKPIILSAILNIYQKGNNEITARMVRHECAAINNNIPWNNMIPAICNSMRNSLDCGGRIIGENRDFNGFTVTFGANVEGNIVLQTKNKTSESKEKSKTIKKEVPQKIKHLEKLELSENFKVVMICSSGKNDSTLDDYPKIKFKAIGNFIDEFHPDEKLPNSTISWRDYLMEHQNDKNLITAYQLYLRTEYQSLYEKFGNSFYILSAGWGLVSSEFKLPNYDITFSGNANVNIDARRSKNINNLPIYNDFNQLDINDNEDIIFIGSPDYIQLFIILTQNLPNRKIIYWKSKSLRRIYPNDTFEYRYFQTNTRTNWYYELACAIAYGIIP
jgi:hypothetical protein